MNIMRQRPPIFQTAKMLQIANDKGGQRGLFPLEKEVSFCEYYF